MKRTGLTDSPMKILTKAPLRAVLVSLVINGTPDFRGKRHLLGVMRHLFFGRTILFPWPTKNGGLVALSSSDLFESYGVGPYCFRHGVWEPHIERHVLSYMPPGSVALDIGANVGYFTNVLARKAGLDGEVYAFEPVPVTVDHLKLTIEANNLRNVTVVEGALGAENGYTEITYSPEILGNASIHPREHTPNAKLTTVCMRTLDSLYHSGVIRKCNFIKIDVEGHELDVFKGGFDYLKASTPDILFEYNPQMAKGGTLGLGKIVTIIREIDPRYEFYRISASGDAVSIDAESLEIPVDCYIDLLASVPK